MPIEKEKKYVMYPSISLGWMDERFKRIQNQKIIQTYLKGNGRIRDVIIEDLAQHYWFNYKADTTDGTVEIETEISEYDYSLLFRSSDRHLRKTRTVYLDGPTGLKLEFDEFRAHSIDGERYLTMIEIEYERGQYHKLDSVAETLEPMMRLEVPDNDKRFTNAKLADFYYAIGLATELGVKG